MFDKITLALFFGHRGFFPENPIVSARLEVVDRLARLGIGTLCAPPGLTRHGAVETPAEGMAYAKFLADHRGKYDAVLLVLPNIGDENSAAEALRDCGTPIYLLAYPDTLDAMDKARRRDAFCGKLSIMNVFRQSGIAYTAWAPHTLSPASPEFAVHMRDFAAVCRIVRGLRRARVGALGARHTAFKSIRYDEVALQRVGATVEAFDNADLLLRVQALTGDEPVCRAKAESFRAYADFSAVPPASFGTLTRLAAAIDGIVAEYRLDAVALRCCMDIEQVLKVSPCVVLSDLNERGIAAACEADIASAVMMRALALASDGPSACLDWNNNYGDLPDHCFLFHCGPVPQALMAARGRVADHPMFAKAFGAGCGFGCNEGRLRSGDATFASLATVDGRVRFYAAEGGITNDDVPPEFLGCAGVAHLPELQKLLAAMGREGYGQHVGMAAGCWRRALSEALGNYLGYDGTGWE